MVFGHPLFGNRRVYDRNKLSYFCYDALRIIRCGVETLGFQPKLCEDSQNDYAYDHDTDADQNSFFVHGLPRFLFFFCLISCMVISDVSDIKVTKSKDIQILIILQITFGEICYNEKMIRQHFL